MRRKDPQESKLVKHIACEECGSSDANGLYDDGHTWCYSCGTYKNEKEERMGESSTEQDFQTESRKGKDEVLKVTGEIKDLPSRRLREDTLKLWGYRQGTAYNKKSGKEEGAQIAYYFDPITLEPVAAKARFANKEFTFLGTPKKAPLYGQWLWKPGGKIITVTEGEIDALSVSQANGNKWPVVSVQNGAQGASRSVAAAIDYLNSFDKVVFMFDMDEPGRAAAVECAQMLPPGKAFIAKLDDAKDANDLLKAGRQAEIVNAIFNAQPYRPDGIVSGAEITRDQIKKVLAPGYDIQYPILNEMIGGLREAELTLLTAGSGIGKSTIARELAYYLHQQHGLTIGNIFLEESIEKTAQGYVAIHNNVPLGKLRKDPNILTDEQWDDALNNVIHTRMYFHRHFGSMDSDELINKIRYLRVSTGCNFVILDHISIVVSGQESSSEGERKDIDRLMTKLRSLIEETGVGIIAIVHLKQPEGKPHEEGGRVTLSQLRGSGSLKQLSDNVIALERDQQGDNKNQSQVRILKCREFGDVALADTLLYNKETGRLLPVDNPFMVESDGDF